MICVKSNKEIEKMQKAGAITAGALIAAGEAIRPGMTTSLIKSFTGISLLMVQSQASLATADFQAQPAFPSTMR